MSKQWITVLCVQVFAASLIGSARADEMSELRQQQEQLYKQLAEMNSRLAELESANQEQEIKLTHFEENANAKLPESLVWLEDIKLYGDFRYRFECRDRDWKSDPKDDRHRIRARVGVQFQINPEMMFDFRIATGEVFDEDLDTVGGDPVSGNKTLGEYWATKNAWIDRAYLMWNPDWMRSATFLFGKMGNPFYLPGKSDLVWDHDLNPEGIGIQYALEMSPSDTLFANGFFGTVQENGSSADKRMAGGQIGLTHTFEDKSKATAGLSYFDYSNVEGEEPIITDAFAGNSNDGSVYLFDYNLLELFGEYAMKIGNLPVSVFGDYVVNTASGVSEDTGWLAGFKLNKIKKTGDWDFTYNYRDLEADAAFGAFTDSDFIDGGTNGRGHKFSANYMFAENTTFGVTYFINENLNESPQEDSKRLQMDLVVKF